MYTHTHTHTHTQQSLRTAAEVKEPNAFHATFHLPYHYILIPVVGQRTFPEASVLHLHRPRVGFDYFPHLDTCAACRRWRLRPPQDAWSRWSTPDGRPPPAVPHPALGSSAAACTGKDTVTHPATCHTHITKPSAVACTGKDTVTHPATCHAHITKPSAVACTGKDTVTHPATCHAHTTKPSAVACTGKDTVTHPATCHTHITKPSAVACTRKDTVTHPATCHTHITKPSAVACTGKDSQTSSNLSHTHYKAGPGPRLICLQLWPAHKKVCQCPTSSNSQRTHYDSYEAGAKPHSIS